MADRAGASLWLRSPASVNVRRSVTGQNNRCATSAARPPHHLGIGPSNRLLSPLCEVSLLTVDDRTLTRSVRQKRGPQGGPTISSSSVPLGVARSIARGVTDRRIEATARCP